MATGVLQAFIQRMRGAEVVRENASLSDGELLGCYLDGCDPEAFETLFYRHSSMVLGVCGRALGDTPDAEDAFQATFLVLARKAGSVRPRALVGNWLYGVACNLSFKVKAMNAKRRAREATVPALPEVAVQQPCSEWSELKPWLDAELSKLPDKYRVPIVLCDLEGKTQREAAQQLDWPLGTLASRLVRGKTLLTKRLQRRGLRVSGGVLATLLLKDAASTAASGSLAMSTLNAARLVASGQAATGLVSTQAATLVQGAVNSMFMTKVKLAAALVLMLGVAGTGAGALYRTVARAETAEASPGQTKLAANANADAASSTVEQFKLKNGLTVILRPIKGADQTALLVLYSLGDDHDPKGRSGLAQTLSSIYATAAAGPEKARTIDEFSKRYLAGANVQTGDDYTLVTTLFPKADLDKELADAAARMGELRITAADLEREKPSVLAMGEFMFGGAPQLVASNRARERVAPVPFGGRRGGLPDQIAAITVTELQDQWTRYYKPKNAIVVIAGAVDIASARKIITDRFEKLPAGETIPKAPAAGRPTVGNVEEFQIKPTAENTTPSICLAYASPTPQSELYPAFLVLTSRIAANMADLGKDPGAFIPPLHSALLDDPYVVSISSPGRKDETALQAEKRLKAFVAAAVNAPLSPKETENVRADFGDLLGLVEPADAMLVQNPYFAAFTLGRRLQFGIDAAKLKADLAKVTDADLKRAAKEIFGPDRSGGAFVTPNAK
jgi:zinc protease